MMIVPFPQEDPDIPFTEEDYRKRRSHPNFKDQVAVEKLLIKLGKTVSCNHVPFIAAKVLLLFVLL